MSAEIVLRGRYFKRQGDTQPERDAQHDLEAFFWVLCYLCLSRGAPARRRADLLEKNSTDMDTRRFRSQFENLFEARQDTMADRKCTIMTEPADLKRMIGQISDWCRPLVPLVEAFHKALVDAYQTRENDGLYDVVIGAFDEALELDALKDDSEHNQKYLIDLHDELERRRKDLPGDWDNLNSPPAKTTKEGLKLGSTAQFLPQAPPSPSPGPRTKRTRLG